MQLKSLLQSVAYRLKPKVIFSGANFYEVSRALISESRQDLNRVSTQSTKSLAESSQILKTNVKNNKDSSLTIQNKS